MTGSLVLGSNSGARVLNEDVKPIFEVDDHHPSVYGRPLVWMALEDVGDLPAEVREVAEPHY